jgi:hypothetical protein
MLLFGACEPFDAETNPELLATQPGGFEAEALRMRTVGRVIRGHSPSKSRSPSWLKNAPGSLAACHRSEGSDLGEASDRR